jgi:hypothetical protein
MMIWINSQYMDWCNMKSQWAHESGQLLSPAKHRTAHLPNKSVSVTASADFIGIQKYEL